MGKSRPTGQEKLGRELAHSTVKYLKQELGFCNFTGHRRMDGCVYQLENPLKFSVFWLSSHELSRSTLIFCRGSFLFVKT